MTVLMRHSGRERQADRPVCANEGANGAEALCVIVARIALPPIGCNGFRAAQPETTVGDEGAGVQEHAVNEGLRHGVLQVWTDTSNAQAAAPLT